MNKDKEEGTHNSKKYPSKRLFFEMEDDE